MHSRLGALRRLMSLYGSIEEMHSVNLQRTMAAVREVDLAIDAQQKTVHASRSLGRDALIAGDRMNWAAARMQRESAEWKQQRLQPIRLELRKLSDEAKGEYQASHLRSQQIQQVVGDATMHVATKAGRQMQAALDDRFLSRLRWTHAREELHATSEINIS